MTASLSVPITLPNGRSYKQPLGLFINNEFVPNSDGTTIEVINPTTEKAIASVFAASVEDVDRAVSAARAAFEGPWREYSAAQRGKLLHRIAELIFRDRELLASIDAYDNGKPYTSAMAVDLDEAYEVFRYYAGWADKIYGKTIETSPAKFAYTLQEPLGVCTQIIPWNYPLMMLAWKVAPAIACGNTVVLKPAEQTPLSALYFGNPVKEAGALPGVINILSGYGRIAGAALASHMDVDKVAFTGSTATGRAIMRAATSNLKNIPLECGGKSPLIVFDDADIPNAVKHGFGGIMSNQGQIFTATSRIYVQDAIYDEYLEQFVQRSKQAKLGDPFTDGTTQGPQVSRLQYEKILGYVDEGKREGASLVAGGLRHGEEGYFVEPTIFANVTEEMKIVQEEIFGPFVTIHRFSTEPEAIKRANASSYGLAAAVFTENLRRAHRVAGVLQAGMVWINSSQDSHYGIPFGGYKSSGIGRELGSYALDSYTQTKAVHVNMNY